MGAAIFCATRGWIIGDPLQVQFPKGADSGLRNLWPKTTMLHDACRINEEREGDREEAQPPERT